MTKVLIVDDSAGDRALATAALEGTGVEVVEASSAEEAARMLDRQTPDLVITDLLMGTMSGLELVRKIAQEYPSIPVILMTGVGSEEIAAESLRCGAASYVPKYHLLRDLGVTVAKVLAAALQTRVLDLLPASTLSLESRYVLRSDPAVIGPLVAELQAYLIPMDICDRLSCTQVGIALTEALDNAILHGNLGIPGLGKNVSIEERDQLLQERRRKPSYSKRRVMIDATFSREEARYVIRDEGRGFNVADVPDPTKAENLEKCGGRGLLLIRTFIDEVRHNAVGNEITMIKRRVSTAAELVKSTHAFRSS